jgi:hypothetical protein
MQWWWRVCSRRYVVAIEVVVAMELSTNRYLKFLWLRKASASLRALTKRGSETDSTPHEPAFVCEAPLDGWWCVASHTIVAYSKKYRTRLSCDILTLSQEELLHYPLCLSPTSRRRDAVIYCLLDCLLVCLPSGLVLDWIWNRKFIAEKCLRMESRR